MSSRELRRVFSDMPAEYLACRDLGHDVQRGKVPTEPIPGGWQRSFHCNRCGVTRIQEIDRSGYIVRSYYQDYPEGYAIRGFGHLKVDDLAIGRLANIREGEFPSP